MSRALVLGLMVAFCASGAGCGRAPSEPPPAPTADQTLDGRLLVTFVPGVGAPDAARFLTDRGLSFDSWSLLDCSVMCLEVTEAPVEKRLPQLRSITGVRVAGVTPERVYGIIPYMDGPATAAIAGRLRGLELERIFVYPVQATVHVPKGREEAWGRSLESHAFVAKAEGVVWRAVPRGSPE